MTLNCEYRQLFCLQQVSLTLTQIHLTLSYDPHIDAQLYDIVAHLFNIVSRPSNCRKTI